MTERYGEIPKTFSKEWWPYFWLYYKWHTIITVIVLFAIVLTVVQCVNKEKYDVHVNYLGEGYISEETIDKIETSLEEFVPDIDGNGEKNLFFQQMNLSENDANVEMAYALQTKHDVELSYDTSHLYIYDRSQAERIMGWESADEIYTPIDSWYDGEYDDSMVIKSDSGTPLAISLKGSKFFEELGVNSENLYVAIKLYKEENADNMSSYEGALAMADAMMK